MTQAAINVLFWCSLLLLAYTYVLYPLLLFCLATLVQAVRDLRFVVGRTSRRVRESELPRVDIVVAAHNEEDVIAAKVRNTAELRYPADRIQLVLGLDAPTDDTEARARAAAAHTFGCRVVRFPERRGKLAVIRDLVETSPADVIVFSDANTLLDRNCVLNLARHFADPAVGAVCGELQVVSAEGGHRMESFYWRYEVGLKFLESRLNCVLGANGAVYAVRRELFRSDGNWIIEDFQLPMEIRISGKRVVYDPEAIAAEEAAPTLAAEFQRKSRIGAGNYQVLLRNPSFLNPLNGMVWVAYISHKVLRWLAPLLLIGAFTSNLFLLRNPLNATLFGLQAGFYLLAAMGWIQARRGRRLKILSVPLYFCSMNLALLNGMRLLITGRHSAIWSRTARAAQAAAVDHASVRG